MGVPTPYSLAVGRIPYPFDGPPSSKIKPTMSFSKKLNYSFLLNGIEKLVFATCLFRTQWGQISAISYPVYQVNGISLRPTDFVGSLCIHQVHIRQSHNRKVIIAIASALSCIIAQKLTENIA